MLTWEVEVIDDDGRLHIPKRCPELTRRYLVHRVGQCRFVERIENRLFHVLDREPPSGNDCDAVAVLLDTTVVCELGDDRRLSPTVPRDDLYGFADHSICDLGKDL